MLFILDADSFLRLDRTVCRLGPTQEITHVYLYNKEHSSYYSTLYIAAHSKLFSLIIIKKIIICYIFLLSKFSNYFPIKCFVWFVPFFCSYVYAIIVREKISKSNCIIICMLLSCLQIQKFKYSICWLGIYAG